MASLISPRADASDVADRQIPTVAASGYRERAIKEYLLGLGGTKGLNVRCVPNERTAYIEQDIKEEAPTITIPAKDWDQPFTEFDQEAANRLIQYGLALHEHGHDRYTPGPYLKTIFNRQQWELPQNESLYWNFINALEDHRIESALIEDEGKWARERLRFVGQTLLYCAPENVPDSKEMTWASALRSASIHYGKGRERLSIIPSLENSEDERLQWRSDTDKHIYYFVLPGLKAALEDVAGEPDGKAAIDRVVEFDKQLDAFLAALDDEPDRNQKQEDATSDDGTDRDNDMGGQKEAADSLEEDNDNGGQESDGNGEEDEGDASESDAKAGGEENDGSDDGDGAKSERPDGDADTDNAQDGDGSEQQPESGGGEVEDKRESDNQDADESSEADSASGDDADPANEQDTASGDKSGERIGEESATASTEADSSGNGSDDTSPTDDRGEPDPESDGGKENAAKGKEQSISQSANEPDQNGAGGAGSDTDGEDNLPDAEGGDIGDTESDKSGRQQAAEESSPAPGGEPVTSDNVDESADSGPEPPSEGLQEKETRKALQESRRLERDKERLEQEVQQLQQALGGGDGAVTQIEMVDQSAETENPDVWDQVVDEGRFLKPPLSTALQNTRQSEERRGTRTGTFDPKLSRRLSTGNLAVNKHSISGNELEYAVIIVLDRSGSMSGKITEAEVATGGFAQALEALNINVAVMDLYRNRARMVKPFGTPTDQVRGSLTSGSVGGGTPLTDALVLSRERVKQEQQRPFMFVVSDGLPSDKDSYLDELEATYFPVIGINIGSGGVDSRFEEFYDVYRSATPETVSDELSNLATEIMF